MPPREALLFLLGVVDGVQWAQMQVEEEGGIPLAVK